MVSNYDIWKTEFQVILSNRRRHGCKVLLQLVGQRTGRSGWRTREGRRDGNLQSRTGNCDMTLRENTLKETVAAAPSTIIACVIVCSVHVCMVLVLVLPLFRVV